MQEVLVINRDVKPHVRAYNGISYTFVPGEKVSIPEEAAAHIFGFNQLDRGKAWARFGLTSREEGERFLDKFSLELVEYVRKDEMEELSHLKILLEQKDEEIGRLNAELEKKNREAEQLRREVSGHTHERTAKKQR